MNLDMPPYQEPAAASADPRFISTSRLPYVSEDAEHYRYPVRLQDMQKSLPRRVLSEADWLHWQRNGYVIVKQAIPREQALATLAQVWAFTGKRFDQPHTWLRPDSDFAPGWSWQLDQYAKGMVEMYHHQQLWDNRTAGRIYDAFVDVWDVEQLWVSIDRVNLNTPTIGNRAALGSFMHWDIDINQPVLPLRAHGLLMLCDTATATGGFQCVPGLFGQIDAWRSQRTPGSHPHDPAPEEYARFAIVQPQLQAGDMLIFNTHLLHGIAKNLTQDQVRAVQYVAMSPALERHTTLRDTRIRWWHDVVHPDCNPSFLGDPLRPEASRYGRASLSPLGRKLLGLDSWQLGPVPSPFPG